MFGLEEFDGDDWAFLFAVWAPTLVLGAACVLMAVFFVVAVGPALIERINSPRMFTLRTDKVPRGKSGGGGRGHKAPKVRNAEHGAASEDKKKE